MIHWKRRCLQYLMVTISLVLLTLVQSQAQAVVDIVAIPETDQVEVSDTFSVVVQIQAGQQGVVGATMNLRFDPALLQVIKTMPGSTLETQLSSTVDNTTGKLVYAAGTLLNPPKGTWNLLEIRFKAIGKASACTLRFDTSVDNPERTEVAHYGAVSVLRTAPSATVMIIANNPPIAHAGVDISKTDENDDGKEVVTLDGSASSDTDGSILYYVWKVGGEEIATGVKPEVIFNTGQTTVTLEVTDDRGATASDKMVVTVDALSNKAPTAKAGSPQTLTDNNKDGREEVSLDGSQSQDPDGTIVSYSWKIGETEIATGVTPKVILTVGTTLITLTVTDDKGLSSTDDVTVTVNLPANQPPMAVAGKDITLIDENKDGTEKLTLDGSGSGDYDGTIVAYQWRWSTGSASGKQPQVTLPQGQTTIILTVRDDQGAEATDTLVVTIRLPYQPPVAQAGSDILVEDKDKDGKETVVLNGTASLPGSHAIIAYSWSTAKGNIASGIQPTVTLPVGETYITLTVTDQQGLTSTDVLKVTVLPNMNKAPIADAGPDLILTDEDGDLKVTLVLNGANSIDSDGIINAYFWNYEGLEGTIVGANPEITLPVGTIAVKLTVVDDRGETSTDVVNITIKKKNQPPVAHAGDDQVVNDEDGDGKATVTLDASQSKDEDGTVLMYAWYNSVGQEVANGPAPNLILSDGVSELWLVVTDDQGAKDTASVSITVMKALSAEERPGAKETVVVFPNPASFSVSVRSSLSSSSDCYLLDAQGKILEQGRLKNGEITFNISGYPAGIYYVMTEAGGKRTTHKLIIR